MYQRVQSVIRRGIYMNEDKLHLISKIFQNDEIRTVWDSEAEKYYISIIDIIAVLTDSERPRKYWNDLKNKLVIEGSEVSEKIGHLKLKAQDGKYRMTDVCDIEGMFRIIESIPSKNAEPIKKWLARLGKERIDETFDPSLSIERTIDLYRAKGYDEEWIIKRIKGIYDRKKLTDVWSENGVTKEIEYAILTNEIYEEWSGMTSKQYKTFKGLRKESLRDNMSDIEVALTDLGEIATRELVKKHKPYGFEKNMEFAKMGGNVAKVARSDLENKLGSRVINKENLLPYKYDEK